MSLHTFPPLRATRLSCLRGILGTSLISFSRRIVPIRDALSQSRSGKLYGLVRITTDKTSSRSPSSLFLLPLPDHFCELTANEWSGGVVQVGFQPCIPFNRTNGVKLFPRLTRIRQVCWKLYPFWRQPPCSTFFQTNRERVARWLPLLAVPRNKIGQEVCSTNYSRLLALLYAKLWFLNFGFYR